MKDRNAINLKKRKTPTRVVFDGG